MLDQLLMYLGDRVDLDVSFNRICEIFFFPLAWLMGVDGEDCEEVARLIGLKIVANEFVAYSELTLVSEAKISDRSFYIASYALCGFSNLGSIGIQLGGLTPRKYFFWVSAFALNWSVLSDPALFCPNVQLLPNKDPSWPS